MKRLHTAAICLAMFLPTARLHAAGFARSDNFQVLTANLSTVQETDRYAAEVLRCAEWWRREIAREWLGRELPQSVGTTIINVSFRSDRDAGLTWAKDDPRRRFHVLYLSTSPEAALGTTLAHEMVHVVLATRFPAPNRLPAWLEEGIASRYDDEARQQERRDQITRLLETHNWPRLEDTLNAYNISPSDQQAYTVAASLTNFLLERDGDKQKLFAFSQTGCQRGWDAALQQYYGVSSVNQLQRLWQRWLIHR
jgi:hypothetical protein